MPPSTIILDNIVAVLGEALLESRYFHHHAVVLLDLHQPLLLAVVLTELFPDTLLDKSPGIVIKLNVC